MSKGKKIFLGIVSFLPGIFFALYLFYFFAFFFNVIMHTAAVPDNGFTFATLRDMVMIFMLILLCGIVAFILLIYYIIHVINNKAVDGAEKIIWILLLIFLGLITFPVYWYMRIWKS